MNTSLSAVRTAATSEDCLAELLRAAEAQLSTHETKEIMRGSSRQKQQGEDVLPVDWSSFFCVDANNTVLPIFTRQQTRKLETGSSCSTDASCTECRVAPICSAGVLVAQDRCCNIPCPITCSPTLPSTALQAALSCPIEATCCEEPHHLQEATIVACQDTTCQDAASLVCEEVECLEAALLGPLGGTCLDVCKGGIPPCKSERSTSPNITRDVSSCPTCEGEPIQRYSSFQELLDCWCCSDSDVGPCESIKGHTQPCEPCCPDESLPVSTDSTSQVSRSSSASLGRSSFNSPSLSSHGSFDSLSPLWPKGDNNQTIHYQQRQDNLPHCITKEQHCHNSAGLCLPPVTTLIDGYPITDLHTCHWAGCGLQCTSITELASHVNNIHLAVTPVAHETVDHVTTTTLDQSASSMAWSQEHPFECLWDSCQTQESGTRTAWEDGNLILQHILQAHVVGVVSDKLLPVSSSGIKRKRKQDIITDKIDEEEEDSTSSWHPSLLAKDCGCPSSSKGEHSCEWQDCTLTFSSHEALTNHITQSHIGSGRAEYRCQWRGCTRGNRKFYQKQKILRHLQTHTGHRPFACDICHKRFSEYNTLLQHTRTHTKEKPYKCDFEGCNKSFAVAGSLTIHKRLHTGEKPFQCPWPGCDRTFAENSNMTKHMRIHTGEKPFACRVDGCNKTYSRPDQLARHRKVHERDHTTTV